MQKCGNAAARASIAGAMPKGVPYGKFVHDNFDASTKWKERASTRC